MTNYHIYPDLPKEPLAPPQAGGLAMSQSYCLNIIQSKRQGLLKLEERYAKKYSTYSKIFNIKLIGMAKRLLKQHKHGN